MVSSSTCALQPLDVPRASGIQKPVQPLASQPQVQQRSREGLQSQIMGIIAGLTGSDIAPDQPLAAQGLDSLASMELRQKLQVMTKPLCKLNDPPEHVLHSWVANLACCDLVSETVKKLATCESCPGPMSV